MEGVELGVEKAEQALSSGERHSSGIAHECCQALVTPNSSTEDLYFFILAFSKHDSLLAAQRFKL